MQDHSAIHEYQEILCGQKQNMTFVFRPGADAENKKLAGEIWKYAIDEILKWEPEVAVDFLNNKVIEALKLHKTYFAFGMSYRKDEQVDFKEILQYAYPDRIKYNSEESTINRYEKILHVNKYQGAKKKSNFPRNFFKGKDGIDKALLLMKYAVSMFLGAMRPEEMVRFFANEQKASSFLKKIALTAPLKLFKTPLEYYHESIKQDSEKETIYENELLKIMIEEKEKEIAQAENIANANETDNNENTTVNNPTNE